MPAPTATVPSKSPILLAGVLAAFAGVSLFAGFVMLVVGVVLPSKSGAPAGSGGGIFSVFSGGGDSAPEKPGYEDGHPVGLYLMTRYWIATGSLEKAVWYFTSAGRVYHNLEDGFSDETLAAHKGRQGTVSVDGDTMTVRWSDGSETSATLERGDGGFNWDTGIFAPVDGFSESSQLAGKWEGGSSSSFSGSYAASSQSFNLREDGTFEGYSIGSLSSTSDQSSVSAGSGSANSGRWELKGYTLVLTYDDGRVVRGVTFPFDDEETPVYPDRFYFSGVMYKKL